MTIIKKYENDFVVTEHCFELLLNFFLKFHGSKDCTDPPMKLRKYHKFSIVRQFHISSSPSKQKVIIIVIKP